MSNYLETLNFDCPYSGILVPSDFQKSEELFPIFRFDNLTKNSSVSARQYTSVTIDSFRHPRRALRNSRMVIMNFDGLSSIKLQSSPCSLIWDYIYEIKIKSEELTISHNTPCTVKIGGPSIPHDDSILEILHCLEIVSQDRRGYEHFYACAPWSISSAIDAFNKWQRESRKWIAIGNQFQNHGYWDLSTKPMVVFNTNNTASILENLKPPKAFHTQYDALTDAYMIQRNREDEMGMPRMIEEVIFQEPATIVKWSDGTKTVVKCKEGETFEKEVGLAMAIAKKYFGDEAHHGRARFKKEIDKAKVISPKEKR